MGNTSSAISGAATIDSYIDELGSITFEKSLSSSRFLKCVRGRHEDGRVVVKLFVKAGALSLKKFAKQLQHEKELLIKIPNALSYQLVKETDRAGYLVRQYIANNLYDRISTRPFLESIEKRWIVFQLLSSLRDCHTQGIHHGDIKTENVLVTSWNWVYLTDFAFFKPTYLPENNPADFSYYFDTSFRRTCYVAPERFLGPSETKDGFVTDAMDIFSLGCVIAELFLEGSPLFDLSQLFKYKAGEYDPTVLLEKVDDVEVRSLIMHMIALDPDMRYSADEYLFKWRRRAFPNYFMEFLHGYIGLISEPQRHTLQSPSTDVDDELTQIFLEFDKLSFHLGFDDQDTKILRPAEKIGLLTSISIPNYQPGPVGDVNRAGGEEGALIFLSIVLSGVRNTKRSATRVKACDIMLALSERVSDEAKLDRVVPFLSSLLTDDAPEVRANAVRALTQVLAIVKVLTPVNAFVFPEYILPHFRSTTTDPSVIVRISYAQSLALIAETASRFLDMAQALRLEGFLTLIDATETENDPHEEDSFAVLFENGRKDQDRMIHEHVLAFLTDSESTVRQTLLDSIARLSAFFGRQKANDVILSHLITFLNDRNWLLKSAFFRNIVDLSRYLGQGSVEEYIVPIMVQALTDVEDFIVEKVLNALAELCRQKLIGLRISTGLISVVIKFLVHPNLWIQEAVAGYIVTATQGLASADIYCIVLPQIRPFLRTQITDLSATVIIQTLRRPLPTQVLDQAIKWAQASTVGHNSQFWSGTNHLREFSGNLSSVASTKSGVGLLSSLPSTVARGDGKALLAQRFPSFKASDDEAHVAKLRAIGMKPEDEGKLIVLKEYIWRVAHIKIEMEKSALAAPPETPLVITPTTIFFDHLGQEDVQPSRSKHLPTHDVQTVLRDASLNLESNRARRVSRPGPGPSTTPQSIHARGNDRALMPPVSTPYSTTATRAIDEAHDLLERATINRSMPGSRASSINGESKSPSVRNGSTVNLPGVSSKALAAVSTTNTIAIGQLDHLCIDVETTGHATARKVVARASHTYTGTDENVLKILQKVYVENYPETLAGFGNRVTPTTPGTLIRANASAAPWKPKGTLVAHIQEHTAAINCIRISPDSVFFVTCSDDGSVKIWDSSRLENNVVNRARLTYRGMSGMKVKSICFLENSHCLAAASDNGAVHVIKIDCTTSSSGVAKYGAVQAIRQHQLHSGEMALHMEHFVEDQSSILLIATNRSRIVALDLRSMTVAYVLQNPAYHGTPTCLCIDKKKTWLLLGTSRGILDLWDLRFHLRVKSIGLPHCKRINSLQLHPTRGRGRWVCVASAADAEITVWDIEKSTCREIYRPIGEPKLQAHDYQAWEVDESKSEEVLARFTNETSVSAVDDTDAKPILRAMAVGAYAVSDRNSKSPGVYFIGASTDQKIRVWDASRVEQSSVISGLTSEDEKMSYQSTNQGTTVMNEEIEAKTSKSPAKRPSRSMILSDSQSHLLKNHMDTILDVAYLQWPYSMVISADRSGVLKVFT